ncbi:MAG: fibronectin type III domain-containing protein [Bacilli bacterium]|nr:fibronectin type III domain-containing protein [Bacilli bacterium]
MIRVIDPKNNEVATIEGLKKVENGFDVTTRVGSFLIAADYEIETTSTTKQDWKLEVELVNLDSDQNINMGKALNGSFYITTEQVATYELATINSIAATATYNSIEAELNYKNGTADISKYYFTIEEKDESIAYVPTGNMVVRLANTTGELSYIESSESKYKFGNLKPDTAYLVYSYVVDENGIKSNVYTTEVTTEEYKLPEVKNMGYTSELNSISVNVTAIDGSNTIVNYYYSIADGEFVSSTEATHTFTGLTDTTTYKIKIKVEDSEGRFSTIYEENVDTVTYVNPRVTTATTSSTYNSITLTASTEKGTNEITKYYFKKSTDSNWIEQTSNVYTFTDLTEETSYNFQIKASDSEGRESTIYTASNISTRAYVLPTVTATKSVTSSSITVSATGTNGDGTIAKYMYIRDGQSDWTTVNSTSTTNSHTFSGLTPGATYNIQVKVVDSNGRESTEYTMSVKTSNADFTNSTTDVSGTYDGSSKTIPVSLSPTPTTIYYSASTQLTTSNYSSSGTTIKPTRTDAGTTTVYWCAVKSGYNTYCSSNTITIDNATFSNTTSDTTVTYDGNSKSITVSTSPTPTTIYYSTSTKLTTSNYSSSGTTTNPTRTLVGTTTVYWCAEKANYTTYCSSNTITINNATFSNTTSNTTATYDGNSKSITVSTSPTPTTIYYSTSTELTTSNYSSTGTTTKPTRTDAGTTTVYWCAVKANYTTYCSSNTVTVNKASPTFTVSSTTAPIESSATTSSVTYTYDGDGTVSCTPKSPSTATYASCSVNTSTKTITFTRKAVGTQTFTISASAGTNYSAGTSKTVSVVVSAQDFSNSTSNTTATYDGSSKTFTVSVSPTATTIYYSTSTQLTTSNYSSSGTTTKPTRTDAGTTTVYWCAVKSGYNTYCSSNTITINKATPTFTVSNTSVTMGSGVNTSSITYTYSGDGTVSCSPTSGTYANCSVNTSTKTITFTRKAAGTQTFTISASEGTNYVAETKTVSVKVEATSSGCFEANTLVYTPDGYKNIQSIKEGDQVYSYNEETGIVEIDVVDYVISHPYGEIIDIELDNNVQMHITANHPVYDPIHKEWKEAGELKVGDYVMDDNGDVIKITNISVRKGDFTVYNFEVKKNHNYFVTNKNILVHNVVTMSY